MPNFDEPETVYRTALCAHCETLGHGQWSPQEGTFEWQCACTEIALCGLTAENGPGEVRVCTLPHRMVGIRPSRRLLSLSRGRVWRQVWRSPEGSIVQSGADYVAVPNAEGRQQFWTTDFEQAFYELTGTRWAGGKLENYDQ
jgi:hypothetical protein